MALNLIEDRRLVYHDEAGDTLKITDQVESLWFENSLETQQAMIVVDRDAVETLRDCLTRWLETGKFTEGA